MKNITSKVSRDDMDNARIDRNRTANPADVEPGMGDFDWGNDGGDLGGSSGGWGQNLGSETSTGTGGGMGGPFGQSGGGMGGPFGSGGAFGGPFGGTFGQQPEKKKDDIEEKFWEGVKKVGMGFFTFTGELVRSFKTFDVVAKMSTGKSIMITGVIVAIVGIILLLFSFGGGFGVSLLIGGLVACGIGVPMFMFAYDNFSKNGAPQREPETAESAFSSEPDGFGDDGFGAFGGEETEEFNMFGDDEEDEFTIGDSFESSDVDFTAFDETSPEELSQNMGSVLEGINVDRGMLTRQYLYENIANCLMTVNKNFDGVKNIVEGSAEFDAWDAIIQNSAGVFKPKGNDVEQPYLIEAKEKLFYILLEIKRVNWIKNIDSFVSEIVNICRFDKDTGKTDMTIYGIGNTVGDRIFVKIMKGETAMVTVKDSYKNVASDVKDNKNFMPIVLGLDAEGSVVWRDFKDINSILVTGMPRSGKTWLVQSILAQMMFFLKPSELNFYILDPKAQISDFKAMQIPHIRKFVSTDETILKELRNIVKVEGPRRKKIIGDAGFVNIWDFKKRNPDVDLPLLYVVIDEVITLAERMDKDVKEEFQGLLLELVSQLPALGIRIFMIPHVVKDQILKKSITDLVPCRISVRGDADHIERSVGAKNFKHKLFHQGDMAVRFNNDEPMFIHSAVLTSSNEGNNDLFDFLLKFWSKIEPESIKGSLFEKRQIGNKIAGNLNGGGNSVNVNLGNSGNPIGGREVSSKKLSKDGVSDLLKGVHGDDDLDLWEK